MFLALTIIIGVLAGLSAVLFSLAIGATSRSLFGLAPSPARLMMIPPLVGPATGILLARVFPGVRAAASLGQAAFPVARGVIPASVPDRQVLTGVLCIASGHSIGREGRPVQIGAGSPCHLGQRIGLSPARIRAEPVGAAAALSAAFNTPVAAVIFTLGRSSET